MLDEPRGFKPIDQERLNQGAVPPKQVRKGALSGKTVAHQVVGDGSKVEQALESVPFLASGLAPESLVKKNVQVQSDLGKSKESYSNLFNLLDDQVKEGDEKGALKVFNTIVMNIKRDKFSFNVFSKLFGNKKNFELMIKNTRKNILSGTTFSNDIVKKSEVEDLFIIIDQMKSFGIRPDKGIEKLDVLILKLKLAESIQKQQIEEVEALHKEYQKLNFEEIWKQQQSLSRGHQEMEGWKDQLTEKINAISSLKMKVERLPSCDEQQDDEKIRLLQILDEIFNGLAVMQDTSESRLKQEISQQKAYLKNQDILPELQVNQAAESQSFLKRVDILQKCDFGGNEDVKNKIISFANRFLSLNPEAHTFRASQDVENKPFYLSEISELEQCIEVLEKYPPKPEEKFTIESFLQDLRIGLIEVKEAQSLCAQMDNKEITSLLNSMIVDGKLLLPKKGAGKIINQLSDFYWAYSPPFGIKIEMSSHLRRVMPDEEAFELKATLQKILTFQVYQKLSPDDLREVQSHTLERLNRTRAVNRAKWEGHPARVNIVGGGPGGLARGIVASTLGANWQVVEMREREKEGWVKVARKNVVKIDSVEAVQFLLFSGVIETLLLEDKISIKKGLDGSNYVMASIGSIEEAMTKALKSMEDEGGGMVSAQAVDIRTGLNDEEHLITEVIVKGEDQPDRAESDVVVLADGAGGIASKIFGDTREALSNQTMMFAVNLENCQPGKKGEKYFYTPPPGQIKFDKVAIHGMLGSNAYATLLVSTKSAREIRAKQRELSKIGDPIERKEAEDVLNQWFLDSATSYMEWLGYKTLNPSKESLAKPFNVTIAKADKPSKVEGDALILRAGDAYATPDPLGSIGLATAIATALQFSDILTSKLHGKTVLSISEEHNYASGKTYDNLVIESFSARERNDLFERTPLARLRQFIKRRGMNHEMANGLTMAFQKHQSRGTLAEEDIGWLTKAQQYLEGLDLAEDNLAQYHSGEGGEKSLQDAIEEILSMRS